MVFAESIFLKIFGVLVAIILVIIAFFRKSHSYWKNLGLQYIEPSIPYGNFKENFHQKISAGDYYAKFYNFMRARKLKHAGVYFFHLPVYVPIDLDLIKNIMQNDFAHFMDHGGFINEKDDPLSAHLFRIGGQKWRNLRVKMTPTFTSGKMKMMYPIIQQISQELVKTLEKECEHNPIDAKEFSARFTTDVIGNCAFGLDCNSLKDPKAEFRVQGKRMFQPNRIELVINFLGLMFPNVITFFGGRHYPKDAAKFFLKMIGETVEHRRKSGFRRNDAFQLLLDMLDKEGEKNGTSLTFNELAAEAFVFFAAGFETSSSLMSFAMWELSLHEDVQNRLREEVMEVLKKNNGEVTYETLSEMKYLGMVIDETLRKYPPLPTLPRECTKDYRVPNSDIIIRKGDRVVISIKGIQNDPELYPNPENFDPTRFTEENKSKLHPFAFIPFGEGPRICLGLRFGLMQAKVGLASLIANFKFKPNPRTDIPVKIDPKAFMTVPAEGLWIDVKKIS